MSWSFSRVGTPETSGLPKDIVKGRESWLLAEETIQGNLLNTDQSSSVIDWLPYGKDWILSVSGGATFASGGPIDIDYCDTRSGTFSPLATTAVSLVALGTRQITVIDNSAKTHGNLPYLKLRLDKTASLSATTTSKTVKLRVLCPPGNGIIY